MTQAAFTQEQLDQALELVELHGSVAKAARALGIPTSTFDKRHRRAKEQAEQDKPLPLDTSAFYKRLKAKKPQRLVITWAQNATDVHQGFLKALLVYCRQRRAQLVVIPGRYKNPTSIFIEPDQDADWWAPEIEPYLLDKRWNVCRSLTLLGDIKTQPTAITPLSGMETISGDRSAVVGHPKIQLACVATPHERIAKQLMTTGAVTKKNYTETAAGKKGEFHHSLGAALIEVDGPYFYPRQINALEDGSFIDLDREYTPRGSRRAKPAEALVLGDEHARFNDPAVRAATFGKRGMVATLKPKRLVRHDVHDQDSQNHHQRHKMFSRLARLKAGLDDVADELRATFRYIDETTPAGVENIIVASNHHEHLRRWVEDYDWRSDLKNIAFHAETVRVMSDGTTWTEAGANTPDPFAYWGKQMLRQSRGRTRFLKRDESCRIAGIEVGYHGDQGLNGARGSLQSLNKIGAKTITGHSHTPGIRDGAYAVGTSSRLRLEYNQGPSSWLHTHCVIYANGKRSLLNVVDGKWRKT